MIDEALRVSYRLLQTWLNCYQKQSPLNCELLGVSHGCIRQRIVIHAAKELLDITVLELLPELEVTELLEADRIA